MDGWISNGAAGILYAEDFGDLPAAAPEPAFVAAALTQHDVDAACIRAVRAAEQAWFEGAEQRRVTALEALAAGLREAQAQAAEQAEAVAEGLAQTMLGLLATALPELCRAHGDAEVRAMLARLLPMVARSGPVVVRVHPGLIAALETDLAALDEDVAGNVRLRAANLREGDAKLSWEDGGLVRDTAAMKATLEDCLSQLGLLPPALPPVHQRAAFETSEIRSLEHAL